MVEADSHTHEMKLNCQSEKNEKDKKIKIYIWAKFQAEKAFI